MLNKRLIHAVELSILLGLSTSAYATPTAIETPADNKLSNWTFKANNNQQYQASEQDIFNTARPFNLPVTLDLSYRASQTENYNSAGYSHAAYTQPAYSRVSISTNLVPESSRWYIQAKATTQIKNGDTNTSYQARQVTLDKMPYKQGKYVDFPDIVKTSIPILAPALEVGLNKMVLRRLRKTAERYGPYLAERNLEALLQLNRETQNDLPDSEETDMDRINALTYQNTRFLHNSVTTALSYPDATATQFDFNQSDDMSSVLAYYKAAKKSSSVRVSGEMGYKSERLNWRFGGQKQKLKSEAGHFVSQKNINIYSALNLKLADRLTYFNVTARETGTNTFGIDGLSTKRQTDYHRLNYNLSDDFSVFAAQGKIDHDIFGKTQSSQIGIKNCWSQKNTLSFCSSIGHQNTQYSAGNNGVTTQERNSGYMALMTFRMAL
jgi:hypothetical protein